MEGEAQKTTDHEKIKEWVEERDGKPAIVRDTEEGEGMGLLRINFLGYGEEESLKEISWDEFFDTFEMKNLAFLYQEKSKGGENSRFFKFVNREE